MKILGIIRIVLMSISLPATVVAGQDAVLLLSQETQSADSRTSLDKFKAEMVSRGVSVTEMPADEVQNMHQAALAGGAATVVKMESVDGKTELRAYDAITGKDITKAFNAEQGVKMPVSMVEQVIAVAQVASAPVVQAPEAPKPAEKPVAQPAPRETSAFARNRIGLSMGPSNFTKNKDSLEMLQQGNPGSQITYTKTSGRFQLFYERDLSKRYTLGLSGEFEKGGGAKWDNNGRTLSVDPKHKVANIYIRRNFGRHFGLYLGGGADIMSLRVYDPNDMSGIGATDAPFKSDITTAHAEAGVALSAGNFSLRFSLRKILAAESSEVAAIVNGAKYRLTIKNGKTLSSKSEGQPLGANEQLYKADSGGTAAAISLTYSFANW